MPTILFRALPIFAWCAALFLAASAKAGERWWPAETDLALSNAGGNRLQLENALAEAPAAQREGLRFLIENMPPEDLQSLSSKFLLDHVADAYAALERAPWKARISPELFLNEILPYASLTEPRDDSIRVLGDRARALTADCRSPAEAALRLNEKLFALISVRYSTERKRPDQSGLESMESGKASCSGLSILLVEACRAVGVPARVAGTPMWSNGRGNHTWVEIWDGQWQFLGAAEPDAKGLNHAWFEGDAAQARSDAPQNAIYATSFKKTDVKFPLGWAPEARWVNAVNVTDRYAKTAPLAEREGKTRVLVKIVDESNKRVAARVTVSDALTKTAVLVGVTKGEGNDLNDYLSVDLPRGGNYQVSVGEQEAAQFQVGAEPEQLVALKMPEAPPAAASTGALRKALDSYFASDEAHRAAWSFPPGLDTLLREHETQVRQIAWEAYRDAPIHQDAQKDYNAKQVHSGGYLSPYLLKTVGTRPAGGYGLVIAMHGGGGTAKEVNDSQWQGMFSHYKEHPELGGYRYVALRAPNDTWNGFYDDYVYPLVAALIQQFTLFGDVNPNKVFILGYSHGGYGAYAIGPKMPDCFAAIHASAAAATDGETAAKNLRNTRFTAMVGEKDLAYDRLSRNQRFDKELKALRGSRSDIYPGHIDVMGGFEHSNLKDGDKLTEMLPVTRNPVPRELTWLQTDKVITDFFWLRSQSPAKTQEIDAVCRDNKVVVTTVNTPSVSVFLDSRLTDLNQPVEFDFNGKKSAQRVVPSLRTLCETLVRRGDPDLAFTVQTDLPMK